MKVGGTTRRHQGFSLVELIIAITMMVMIGISAAQLWVTLVSTVTFMQKRAVALDISSNRMGFLRSLPYDNLEVGSNEYVDTRNGYPYTVKTTVRYVDDYGEPKGCLDYGSDAGMTSNCRGWTKATVSMRPRNNIYLTGSIVPTRLAPDNRRQATALVSRLPSG